MSKVLLIYTGGTIGMKEDPASRTLVPYDFRNLIGEVPELRKFDVEIDHRTFSPLIDSSDVEPELWVRLAGMIRDNYDRYDGFVILHGTDTMAYSASAMSFMLDNLTKPVIFTGSQLPIGRARTDGRENLISSIEIAAAKDEDGHAIVPEVCICFNSELIRGNRATKVSASTFDAFRSPNWPLLATAGISIRYNRAAIRYPEHWDAELGINTHQDTRVSVLKVHPGITRQSTEDILLGNGSRAVILETYGSGNVPARTWFIDTVKESAARGKVLLNVTQCLSGEVDMSIYANGKVLVDAGVTGGLDITTEAALGKLFFLLGEYDDNERVIASLEKNLKGEISK